MKRNDGSLGLIGLAFGGSVIGAVAIAAFALVGSLFSPATIQAQESANYMPGFYCETPADVRSVVASRKAGATWYQAIDDTNKQSLASHKSPPCVMVHRLPQLSALVENQGTVLVDHRIFKVVRMDIYDRRHGYQTRYLLAPAYEIGL